MVVFVVFLDGIDTRVVNTKRMPELSTFMDNTHGTLVRGVQTQTSSGKTHPNLVSIVTGLSASGKSTIADIIEQKLVAQKRHTYLLDGDNFRHGLNKDLGFTDADRVENIRRVAEVARILADSGLIVLTAFISPFRHERRMAREIAGDIEFVEVFVDTPLDVCEARDPKGLYAKARRGEIPNFTGIDSGYEAPERADIHLDGAHRSAEELADDVLRKLDIH